MLTFRVADLTMQVRHIIAGTAARTMAQCFIHPIDTVKTRLQARLHDKQPLPLVACYAASSADHMRHSANHEQS